MTEANLFIDGVWRAGAGGRGAGIVNPATEQVIGRVAHASDGDVNEAIEAAERAFPRWRETAPEERGAVLERAAALLCERLDVAAAALTAEQGKTLAESRAEIERAIDTLLWHAAQAPSLCELRATDWGEAMIAPEPIGVVGAFTPWNYPAVIIARKLGAALTAGCTVVLKAAEETPATAVHLVRALENAGLPAGVVNLVFGEPASISSQLLDSAAVRAFSFTGSTAVGKQLAERAARTLKRCVLELGGHAPVIVCADAELDDAVAAISAYKFECAGQSCNAPSRIYVEAPAYERFLDAFVARARALRVGDGACTTTDVGPMANARRVAAMQRLCRDALARGARCRVGGARLPMSGYFWPPTILTDVSRDSAMETEEPFGPIVSVAPFDDFDEAIARSNATPYGLAAYLFTSSHEIAMKGVRSLAAGSVGVNELRGVPPDVGIAGIRDSGYGYEGGRAGVEAFMNLKVMRGISARRSAA